MTTTPSVGNGNGFANYLEKTANAKTNSASLAKDLNRDGKVTKEEISFYDFMKSKGADPKSYYKITTDLAKAQKELQKTKAAMDAPIHSSRPEYD